MVRHIITILEHTTVEVGIVAKLNILNQIADQGVLAQARIEVITGLTVEALTLVLMVFMVGKDGHGLLENTDSMVDQEALEIIIIVLVKMAGAEQEVQVGHTTASMETDATANMGLTTAASMGRHTMKAVVVGAVALEDPAEVNTLEQTTQEEVPEVVGAPITTAPMVVKEVKMDIPSAAEVEVPQPPKLPTPKTGTALAAKEDTGTSKGDGSRQQLQQPPRPLEEDNLAMAMDTQVVDLAAAPALTLRRRPSSTMKEATKGMTMAMVGEQIPTLKPLESLLSITTMKEVMTMVRIMAADQVVPAGLQERSSLTEVEVEKSTGMRVVHQTAQLEEAQEQ